MNKVNQQIKKSNLVIDIPLCGDNLEIMVDFNQRWFYNHENTDRRGGG